MKYEGHTLICHRMGQKGSLKCDLEFPGSYKPTLRRLESLTAQKAPEKPSSGIFPETQVNVCSPASGNTTLGFTDHRPLSGTVVSPPPILAPHSSQCTEGCTCQESAYIEPKHAQVPVGFYGNYIMQQKLINTSTYRRPGYKSFRKTARAK